MASIYTARSIVGNDKTIPLFQLKGLTQLSPSTITNLNIQGIPLERQVAYIQYAANISSFIHASVTRRTVTVSPRPLGLLDVSLPLLLEPPTLSFTLAKAVNSDQSDRLIQKLGPGASKTQSGKTTIYHAPKIDMDQLPLIVSVSTSFFNAGRDAINPRGMVSYIFLNAVITSFLHVHSYPAFREEDADSITEFDNLVAGDFGGKYYAREYTNKNEKGEDEKLERNLDKYYYSFNENNKRTSDDMETEADENAKCAKTSSGVLISRGTETVFRAKPVTKTQVNTGSVAIVPKHTGLLFPYFHGLLQPDANFMNSMILRRFYQLLGNTHEKCQSKYLDIRHGVNSLASTKRGMEICHILLGIDLALETQSRCFVIIEKGEYLGFSLLGARFAIFSNTRWFAPADEESMTQALNRMDPHESAVDDIIQTLEKLSASNQYTGQFTRSMFKEPDTLAEELAKLKVADIDEDDIRDLDRFVRNLNYMGTGYLSQNPQMISDMLATLASNQELTLVRPTYIPSVKAPLSSRHFIALSKFGPEAPSFWNDRGTELICKPVDKSVVTTGGKRKIGEPDIFGNMPNQILITPKPLLIAVRDLDRVVDTGKVKMDAKERAGRYRNICLENEDTKKAVWKGLIDICANQTKKTKVLADRDDEEGGVAIDEALMALLG